MDRIRLKRLHCDSCGSREIYIERESTVGEGVLCLIVGLATSFFILGIPLVIVGIVKLMRGYKWRVYCQTCGDSIMLPKSAGHGMIKEGA